MTYLKITNAAKQKGVSRPAVMIAIASGHINSQKIDGTPHVIADQDFRNWKPKGKKSLLKRLTGK